MPAVESHTTASGGARPLPPQRDLFEIPDDVAYFNCASLAPQLKAARQAAESALQRRAQPWLIRGDDWFTEVEQRRALFAQIAGVDPEGVALVPATSYGLAAAAANLRAGPGQRVVVLAEEYPSNYYTWQRFAGRTSAAVTVVGRQAGQSWGEAVLGALDERTAVVAVPAVHWTDGAVVDLVAVGARARQVGAALVVDASQSMGAMPLDLAAIRPDYLVTVGYKWLLGPFAWGTCTSPPSTATASRWRRTGSRGWARRTFPGSWPTRSATSPAPAGSTWASAPISRPPHPRSPRCASCSTGVLTASPRPSGRSPAASRRRSEARAWS
jgi:kynureninase